MRTALLVSLSTLQLLSPLQSADFGIPVIDGKMSIISPLAPMEPGAASRALDAEEAHTNPLFIDQLGERQVLWVRDLVAKGAGEAAIRSALDGMAAWTRKAAPLRATASDVSALESRLRSEPSNLVLRNAVARYWVRELELERAGIDADKPLMFRIRPGSGMWQCTNCYLARGSRTEAPSAVYARARRAVDEFLSAAPKDPRALWQAALLDRMISDKDGRTNKSELDFEKRAAEEKGPSAAAARIAWISQDGTVTRLLARVGEYRGDKAVRSRLVREGFDLHGHRDPNFDIWEPVFRKATPEELAEANRLTEQAKAAEGRVRTEVLETLREFPAEVDVYRMLAYWPLDRNAPFPPQWYKRERIIRYAIMLDPTDWRLFFSRASNWNDLENKKMEMPSAQAQAILRKNRDGDFNYIYEETFKDIAADPFVPYVFALQAVRRAPAYPFAHQRLAVSMQHLIRYSIDGIPVINDAFLNAVNEMKLAQYAALRLQAHREEWRDEQTGAALAKMLEFTKRQLAAVPARPPR